MGELMQMSLVLRVLDQVTAPVRNIINSVKKLEAIDQWGKRLVSGGAKVTAYGGLMMELSSRMRSSAAGFVAPLEEFEDALISVQTVAPGTFGSVTADMAELRKAALAWQDAGHGTGAEFAGMAYQMIASGLDMRAAIAAVGTGLTVATATMGEGKDAANLLAVVYGNLGNKSADATQEIGRLGDILTKTQQFYFLPNLGTLSEGLKYGVPVAKQYGIQLEQTAAAIGSLNDAGFAGGQAGTVFGATMRNMSKAAKELKFEVARTSDGGVDFIKTLENIKAAYGDRMMDPKVQQRFQEVFGDEGVRGVTLLLDRIGRMRGGVQAMGQATGAARKAQAEFESTGSHAWKALGLAVQKAKMDIAGVLAPAIRDLIPWLKGVVQGVAEFAREHPWIVTLGGAIWGVVFAVISILGPVLVVGGTFAKVFGGGARAVSGLGKALLWLRSGGFMRIVDVVKTVGGGMAWLGKTVFGLLRGAILRVIPVVWSFTAALLSNPLTWIVLGIAALIAGIVALVSNWDAVTAWVGRAWDAIVEVVRSAGQRVWTAVTGAFTSVWDWLKSLPGRFWAAAVAMWDAFIDGVKAAGRRVVQAVVDVLRQILPFLPHSDAKAGPLSQLTASGRALGTTWAQGIRAGIPEVRRAAEALADAGALKSEYNAADVRQAGADLAQAGSLERGRESVVLNPADIAQRFVAFGLNAVRPAEGERRGGVTIQNLTLNVQAKDLTEADGVVRVFERLAVAHGG